MRTLADEPDEGDELLDEREATKERCGRISDFVNKTRLKLATKTRQEKRKLNCAEEELQLKRKPIEWMNKTDHGMNHGKYWTLNYSIQLR